MVQIFIMYSNYVKYQIFRKQNIYKSFDCRQLDNYASIPGVFIFNSKKGHFRMMIKLC